MINIHNLVNPRIWESPAKAAIGIAIVVMLIQEWRKGFFRNFRSYPKTVPFKPYAVIAGLFFILFLLAFSQDRILLDKVQGLKGPFWSCVLLFGRNIGENIKFWSILLAFYWISRGLRSAKGSSLAFGALLASSLTGLLAHILKSIFMRARPYATPNPYSFFNYHEILHHSRAHQSFPSGDVALVAGAAGYLFFSIPNPFFRLLMLLVPLANAFARMSLNRHWASDTVAAMGLGLMTALFFWSFKEYQKKTSPQPRP